VIRERDPRGVVDYALKYRDLAQDDYDQVWCVLDVDDFDFTKALLTAEREGINLAISNPCFEVWLLLHHREIAMPLSGAVAVMAMLKQAVPGYHKASLRFEDFADGVPTAVLRARRLSDVDATFGPNPSSGMWRLVELITAE
jgi:hypothetical protein